MNGLQVSSKYLLVVYLLASSKDVESENSISHEPSTYIELDLTYPKSCEIRYGNGPGTAALMSG